MSVEQADTLESLVVFADSQVTPEYPLCIFRPDEFLAGPTVRLILVTKLDNSYLGCVPQAAWDRLVARRALPRTFLSKAVRVLVKNCREDDRSSVGDSDSVVWLGFIASELLPLIEVSNQDVDAVEVDFGEDQLPFADALVQVAQDHFAFYSAVEEPPEPPAQDAGPVDLSERVQHLEIMIRNLNSTLANMVHTTPSTPRVTFADQAPPAVARKLPSPKQKSKSRASTPEEPENKFPDLDAGVVNAALQAGVEPAALEEMQSLMSKNPKAARALKQTRNAPLATNVLSESEEEDQEEPGSQGGTSDPVASALTKLTKIVGQLSLEKKRRTGSSRLENALDGVLVGHGGESSSSLGSKKSAVARRILRTTLQETPDEIYSLIERLMAEDVLSQTLQPGLDTPAFTARGWVEHRSKIGPYKAVAHASWGIAGVLDQLRKGNTSGARARCCLLLLQMDQSCVDKGNWGLASDLSLELPPPFASLSQHLAPSVQYGDLPYSKLLDPRWAEIALAHLKDQDDYVNRRRNLGKKVSNDLEDPPSPTPKRAAKYKAKAKAAPAVENV